MTKLMGLVDISVGYSVAFALLRVLSQSTISVSLTDFDLARSFLLLGTLFSGVLALVDPVRLILRKSLLNDKKYPDIEKLQTIRSPYLGPLRDKIRSTVYLTGALAVLSLSNLFSPLLVSQTNQSQISLILSIILAAMAFSLGYVTILELRRFRGWSQTIAVFNWKIQNRWITSEDVRQIIEALNAQDFAMVRAWLIRAEKQPTSKDHITSPSPN